MNLLLGSHLSIAGGYSKAVRAAGALGFDSVQVFTKNNNRWVGKPLIEADTADFTAALVDTGLKMAVSHNSYLINLASPDDALWNRSIDAMVDELERAAAFGILDVVAHPGAHMGAGEEVGLERIAAGLQIALQRTAHLPTRIALETTAGQGSCLGHRFEHLAEIIKRSGHPDRLTACLDTCHVFAAGYPLAPRRAYLATMKQFDQTVGLDRLKVLHLNDSKKDFGSRVDRHEHIGVGKLGLEPFANIVNEKALAGVAAILETPKTQHEQTGEDWDIVNARALQALVKTRGRALPMPSKPAASQV